MNSLKMIGVALLIAGALALAYGSFSYTKDATAVKVGPVELSVKQKETVNIPVWAGAGAMLAGGVLLMLGFKKN
jgi:TRAP-type C4-dicarboxylate transport system permease small subunit